MDKTYIAIHKLLFLMACKTKFLITNKNPWALIDEDGASDSGS